MINFETKKVLFIDLDSTLIKTISGKTFPEDITDFRIQLPVLNKIVEKFPKMQSLPQSAKNILMSRENPHIDYTNQMLIINPDGRADSWVPSSSDIFAEDWEVIDE